MDLAVIIPAQETNRYHSAGDLAPFGDTSLLEWKLTQCKEFTAKSNIHVLTSSTQICKIAEAEDVQIINKIGDDFATVMTNAIHQVDAENIMICNVTTPFIGARDYINITHTFLTNEQNDSLTVIKKHQEYALYKDEKLNFGDIFTPRAQIDPIDIICNGVFLFKKNSFEETNLIIGNTPLLYELDDFSSIEIKNVLTYQISHNLIAYYFQKELNV